MLSPLHQNKAISYVNSYRLNKADRSALVFLPFHFLCACLSTSCTIFQHVVVTFFQKIMPTNTPSQSSAPGDLSEGRKQRTDNDSRGPGMTNVLQSPSHVASTD